MGPLIFINNLPDSICHSTLRLFADDCLLYFLPRCCCSSTGFTCQRYVLSPILAEISKPKFCQFWQLMSCHFWQLHKATIFGNFTKLPFLATSQSCHFWQLHKATIFGNFSKLPFLATSQSYHFWQLHKATIFGNFTKLPFLGTSQSCQF